jgi:hypothetical protein
MEQNPKAVPLPKIARHTNLRSLPIRTSRTFTPYTGQPSGSRRWQILAFGQAKLMLGRKEKKVSSTARSQKWYTLRSFPLLAYHASFDV